MASGLFRSMAALGRNVVVASTLGSFALLVILVLGGFVLSREAIPKWWLWGYWFSLLMYGQNAIAVNEFLANSWSHVPPGSTESLGVMVLKSHGIFPQARWYWIGLAALIGYTFLFNIINTFAMQYLNPFGKPQAVLSKECIAERNGNGTKEFTELLPRGNQSSESSIEVATILPSATNGGRSDNTNGRRKRGMVLPFQPLSLAFNDIRYAVDMPQGINGVPKIKDGYNPATWMLEITSAAQEESIGVSFTEKSELYKRTKDMIKGLSIPPTDSKDLYFPTRYSQSFHTQCMACLWKQHWSYWRNPSYTAVRLLFTTFIALLFGMIFWDLGSKRSKQQDIFNAMGSMYSAVIFLGVQNSAAVQPNVAVERTVFYRERAAGMYSALPYAFGQMMIEVPYIFIQTIIYGVIVYTMMGFDSTLTKFLWYLFFMYFTLLYFTFYGMMTMALSPNHNIAAITSSSFYAIWNLFSGFVIPPSRIPIWWKWYYWICPVAWTLYGMATSQFGGIKHKLDTGEAVGDFLTSYFGYKHDFLGVVSVVVVGFSVLFGFIFAYSIRA